MKSKTFCYALSIVVLFLILSLNLLAMEKVQQFDLSGNRTSETQYFTMRSEFLNYRLNGERVGRDIYSLKLKYTPAQLAGTENDQITIIEFKMQLIGAEEVTIPALKNWSYIYYLGINDSNQIFGIDQSKFENLVDSNGNTVPFDKSYQIFNAFVDFHSFLNVFADPMEQGNGIQQLHKIGDKIVHAAANSQGPVHLGKQVSENSFFKNGEITLQLKGQSVVNDKKCAIVGFDSGESSLKMIINPMPNFEVVTVGASHYKGDLYKDLKSNWVQKITFDELVITETTVPGQPKINGIVERFVMIENVTTK